MQTVARVQELQCTALEIDEFASRYLHIHFEAYRNDGRPQEEEKTRSEINDTVRQNTAYEVNFQTKPSNTTAAEMIFFSFT